MPVSLDKPTDTPAVENADPLYLTITQHPDGRIDTVTMTDTEPDQDDTWYTNIRATVWTPLAPKDEDGITHAGKILDLAVAAGYQYEDRDRWAAGERRVAAFHTRHSLDRAALRRTEAEIIRAGHLDVYTSTVGSESYGLTITNGREEYYAYQGFDGDWFMATRDLYANDGWTSMPGVIAPSAASPRVAAAAILREVYNGYNGYDAATPAVLRPLTRARVAYLQWRRTPNWQNFKFRTRHRFNRYRNRITVRIKRG
ncbi:hypothetical protein [Streptomyces rimosus]|uniref:hypothetical protein n=1 Tax=Streptomyces rimosus TaxID=1927 RepID=UPI0004BEA69A|nr:hypothetical protein [Streptomyces rimosus]